MPQVGATGIEDNEEEEDHLVLSVPVCICPLPSLGNCSVNTFPRQQIYTQKLKNCWTRRFLCGPCRIEINEAISSSDNFLFRLRFI
jgi:hypothetical protein